MERWQSKGKVGPYRGVLVPYYAEAPIACHFKGGPDITEVVER